MPVLNSELKTTPPICYPCRRIKVLPMFPVVQARHLRCPAVELNAAGLDVKGAFDKLMAGVERDLDLARIGIHSKGLVLCQCGGW